MFADGVNKVVDHFYTIDENELKAIGATYDKNTKTISAPTKQGTINIKVSYLKTDGTIVEKSNIGKVTFTYSTGTDINVAEAVKWKLTKDAKADMSQNKASITITSANNPALFALLDKDFGSGKKAPLDLASIKFAQDIKDITYEDGSIKLAENQPEKVVKDKVTSYKITFNFDPTNICATTHNVVLNVKNPLTVSGSGLNDEVLKKVNVQVVVEDPGIFAFEP